MMLQTIGRREFFRTVLLTGSGLVLAVQTAACSKQADKGQPESEVFQPNIWLTVKADNSITITISKSEMGQGVYTSLAMLVAEELDADWHKVGIVQAETMESYGSLATAGSASIRDSWLPLREAGATARWLFLHAAAATWQVDAADCKTENGRVKHAASNRTLTYGELIDAAKHIPLPTTPPLKSPQDFSLIGQSVARLDNLDKVTGRARYGIDQRLPGLKYAAIRHAPVFGASVASVESAAVLTRPGILAVVNLVSAVAVVADSWWQAQQAVTALAISWQGGDATLSDAKIQQDYLSLLQQPGTVESETGEYLASKNHQRVTANYSASLQAHATMEPMNCTVRITEGVCEIWAPTQHPQYARDQVKAKLASGIGKLIDKTRAVIGMTDDSVKLHTTLIGGGFGRRLEQDYVLQAVEIALQTGLPIQLIWSREEDIQHDFYRPYTSHQLQAELDQHGAITSWTHRIVGPSHGRSTGGAYIPYKLPHYRLEYHVKKHTVPIGSWRSVGSSHNAFVTESFIDELAHQAGVDALQYRRKLLQHAPRILAVLDQAALLAQWGKKLPSGHGMGIAVHSAFGSIVCQIAEVSIQAKKRRVERVFCVVDCGMVVNPAIVTAQLEGGIAFGLSAALHSHITIQQGRVQQSNFHDFTLLTLRDMPAVIVHIMPSTQTPGGIGEVGVPPIAPAIANAIFAITGERLRTLPLLNTGS